MSLFAEILASRTGAGTIWILLPFVIMAVVIRLLAGNFDEARIRKEVERKGGTIVDIKWNPFGPGWFGSKKERIYKVTYHDRNGQTVVANCKTSLFSGVYWTTEV